VGVAEATPAIDRATRGSLQPFDPSVNSAAQRSLEERVSLIGLTPSGLRLWSDVTTSTNEAYRPAAVNRLVGAIVRAARLAGEDAVFEPNGRGARSIVARRVRDVMQGFFDEGAFRGDRPERAFRVRCDEATTGPTDVDAGRMIVEVTFEAAAPVEQITVTLPLGDVASSAEGA
ncbi:MAG TPA: hypothetical protein PKA64_25665, partial [Myxococcota bacterium]|nr:hypothetical protein [Myxococcota bacterium]